MKIINPLSLSLIPPTFPGPDYRLYSLHYLYNKSLWPPSAHVDWNYPYKVFLLQAESDSGISVNLSHFDPELTGRREGRTEGGGRETASPPPPPPPSQPTPPPPPLGLTEAIREQFAAEFSEWHNPNNNPKKGHSRRKSSTRSLHQKLVVSTNNGKKAAKLDMDDRAKMLQYFSKANDDTKNISIHDLFENSWQIPMVGPRLPTVITVQAPAGIGKSSMLKYMCLQWSEGLLWTDNFDILIFIECRTLNYLGPMSCKEFLKKHVEYVLPKVDPGSDVVSDIEATASKGRLLFLIDGLDEITGVAALASLTPKFAPEESLSPLELVQSLLSSRLAPGSHIIVTSRPHTLTYLQVRLASHLISSHQIFMPFCQNFYSSIIGFMGGNLTFCIFWGYFSTFSI